MHQILTDLNHKMEVINEKSTQFREALKVCIENLGVIASKKMGGVISYVNQYQQKLVYNQHNARKIKKEYRMLLLKRTVEVLNGSGQRQGLACIRAYVKSHQQEYELDKKVRKYYEDKQRNRFKRVFFWLKRQAMAHNRGFKRLQHVDNIYYFYRLAYAFAAIKRTYTAEKYIAMHKQLEDQGSLLTESQENLKDTENVR